MFKVRVKSGAIIYFTPFNIYKRFKGKNAVELARRQLVNQELAAGTDAWKARVLEMMPGPLGWLKSTRAEPLTDADLSAVTKWVMAVTENSMADGRCQRASEIIDLRMLQGLLGDHADVIDRIAALMETIILPHGPTHGDLHRNNILKFENRFLAIDLDRFDLNSCPLFDRLHFLLYEAKLKKDKGLGRRWANLLESHSELVEIAAGCKVLPQALTLAYAVQRTLLEMSMHNQMRGQVSDQWNRAKVLNRYCDLFEAE